MAFFDTQRKQPRIHIYLTMLVVRRLRHTAGKVGDGENPEGLQDRWYSKQIVRNDVALEGEIITSVSSRLMVVMPSNFLTKVFSKYFLKIAKKNRPAMLCMVKDLTSQPVIQVTSKS